MEDKIKEVFKNIKIDELYLYKKEAKLMMERYERLLPTFGNMANRLNDYDIKQYQSKFNIWSKIHQDFENEIHERIMNLYGEK